MLGLDLLDLDAKCSAVRIRFLSFWLPDHMPISAKQLDDACHHSRIYGHEIEWKRENARAVASRDQCRNKCQHKQGRLESQEQLNDV